MATERKGLPLNITRAAEGIVKRLNKGDVVKALLCRTKKEFILEFLLNGTFNEEGPSAAQIVGSLYNGDSYTYGPADARQTIELPANPDIINALAEQVPEEELRMPVVKKSVSAKAAVKNSKHEDIKRMLSYGNVTEDQIKMFLAVTDEDIAAAKAELATV